jgi:serine protease Do
VSVRASICVLPLLVACPALAQELDRAADEAALQAVSRQVIEGLSPSIVEVEALGGLPEAFKAPENEEEAQAQGGILAKGGFKQAYGPSTGVILSADGVIVTSSFVLNRDPRHLFVTLHSGKSYVARVLGRDDSRGLALLKIEAKDLPVPAFATRKETRVGRHALALGRGLGTAQPAVSRGIVSAVDRIGGKAIQSSAAISPVNYGGPLADVRGAVMGILVPLNVHGGMASIDIYDSGIGFAIPAEDVLGLVERLRGGAHLRPGFLGLVPDPRSVDGIRVTEVVPDSPADKAGVWQGDVILSVDGQVTHMAWQLRRALTRRYAGDAIKLRLRRGTKEWEATLTLGEPPQQAGHE